MFSQALTPRHTLRVLLSTRSLTWQAIRTQSELAIEGGRHASRAIGADELLPLLAYVVLRSCGGPSHSHY